jgi:hypothetical protein
VGVLGGNLKKSFLVLLLLSCVYLDSVNQPSSVEIGERFTIAINGNYNTNGWGGGSPWLAMMLPNGLFIDSIRCDVYGTSDTATYVITQPDSTLSAYIASIFPCDSNMLWHGYWGEYVLTGPESIGTYTATVFALATDSTIPGTYLIDYLSGSPGYSEPVINDSIFDQPMLVTEMAVDETVEHSRGKIISVWPTIFNNTLRIFTAGADLVEIFSNDGRLVKSFDLEACILNRRSMISWDGTDQANRQLGSGVYFVKFVSGDSEETEKVLLVR